MATFTAKQRLKLFNERAQELSEYSYVKTLLENPDLVKLNYDGENLHLETRFPDRESTSAFIHVLRQFMQENDAVSFREMAKMYKDLPIEGDLKNEFSRIQNCLNQFLDAQSDDFSIADDSPDGGPAVPMDLQHRRILDTFIYGGFSHNNPVKRAQIDEWRAHEVTFAIVSHIFTTTLAVMFTHIMAAKRLNERVLDELEHRS